MHLVVVQHGLWGSPGNTAYLSILLKEQLGYGFFVLNSDVNSGNLTYDGIDVCGDRLHSLILKTKDALASAGNPVRAISMIGYSMGGLVTRYVAGKLYAEGYFRTITPVNFITIATPHLGAWRMPSNWLNRAFNYMIPVVTSRSGYQMVMQDKHTWGKPLLCLMSHPDILFMRALRCFKKLMLLANVFHDRPVPYCTAAIRLDNPYEKSPPVPIDPKYPSIVTTSAASRDAAAAAATAKQCAADGATTVTAVAVGTESTVYGASITSPADPIRTPESPPAEPSGSSEQNPQLRPLRSAYMPFIAVLCLPLALPALLLMVITGKSHHNKITRTALDFSWIQNHHQPGNDEASRPLPPGGAGGDGRGELAERQGQGESSQGTASAGGKQGRLPSDIECPSAPDLPATASASNAQRSLSSPRSVSLAPASSTALGAMDDGADGVVVSEQSVLLHDGIVELPAEVHRVQQWLVEQLNQLPWQKVDVDCRDYHAHAAIIMRNPARFTHNRDVLDYVISEIKRA